MKTQKKEYEEVRNAELIEAQRFEAAEARVNAEKERRANQQKARKTKKGREDKGQELKRKCCIRAERDAEYQALSKSLVMKTSTEI